MDPSQSTDEKITLLSQNIALSEPSRSHRKRRHFHISFLAALFLLSWWSFNGLPNLRIVLGQDARADDVRQESQDIDFADVGSCPLETEDHVKLTSCRLFPARS
jgi:hypothetical protein